MKKTKKSGVLLVTLIFILMCVVKVNACDCKNSFGLKEADLVFTGKVKKITRVANDSSRYYVIDFISVKCIKGAIIKNKIKISVPCLSVSCCGIEFLKGKTYEVFCKSERKNYWTNLCTDTKRIDK
jgi:hypothetical protein